MTMTVDIGQVFILKLELPPDDVNPISKLMPGDIIMEDINPEYLQILSVRWMHAGMETSPYLGLKMKAIKEGIEEIKYIVELDSENPLFVERKERIIITKNDDSESDVEIIEEENKKSTGWWPFY